MAGVDLQFLKSLKKDRENFFFFSLLFLLLAVGLLDYEIFISLIKKTSNRLSKTPVVNR